MLALYLRIVNLLKRQEGQDLAEYAILIALIALVVIAAVTLVGTNITRVFDRIASVVGGLPH